MKQPINYEINYEINVIIIGNKFNPEVDIKYYYTILFYLLYNTYYTILFYLLLKTYYTILFYIL
mgnify:CR=1 FL=1